MIGDALPVIQVAGTRWALARVAARSTSGRGPRRPNVSHELQSLTSRAARASVRTGAGPLLKCGAADPPPLEERDLCAQFGGMQGRCDTSRTSSDDDNAHLACLSSGDRHDPPNVCPSHHITSLL